MKSLLALLVFLIISPAHAGIQDRINECEKKGGGACMYDLLRELAKDKVESAGPENKCKCTVKTEAPYKLCVASYLYEMTRDGYTVTITPCDFRTQDQAYLACMNASKTNSSCK